MFKTVRQPFFNAEGDLGGGGQEAGGNESASSNSADFSPGWGLPNSGNQAAGNPLFNPTAAPVEQAAVQQGQVFDFAGRKIEVADPSIAAALKDVHKDYTALTGTFTQTSQRVKELEQANQTYLNLLNQGQQQMQGQQPIQSEQQGGPSEEDVEQMKADFMEKFYENPLTAIEGMLEQMFQQKVQPVIEPISKERAWNEQVSGLQQKYPDFQTMIGPMQQLIEEMPELAQHGLESVYHFAKRAQPAQAPTPEQLLSDPNFLQQLSQNPQVQQQFLSQYMQGKQGQQAPTIMGGQPGGQMPAALEDRPKDIRSGSAAFKRYLGL